MSIYKNFYDKIKKVRRLGLLVGIILVSCTRYGNAEAPIIDSMNASSSPVRIALLLPFYGPYAQSGKAIRDGFLAAYYQSLASDPHAPTLRIIDTSNGGIVKLYQDAVAGGANFVVGPLSKEDGAALAQAGLTVPTLLLNNLSTNVAIPNLYQFGLSPEDEAKQVAAKAWADGHKKSIIIAPDQGWGHRSASAFLEAWEAAGGQNLDAMYYKNSQQMSAQLAKLLQIDQSIARSKNLQHQLMQPDMRAQLYRRQDVDMVFLVAKPEIARELRPLLRFYYAGNLPVYATSSIYGGTVNPRLDQDLNGILFADMPWIIAPQTLTPDLQQLLHQVQSHWPKNYIQNPRLFAFGVDSYHLLHLVNQNGATGTLSLPANRIWQRQLTWAQMVHGRPVLIPSDDH